MLQIEERAISTATLRGKWAPLNRGIFGRIYDGRLTHARWIGSQWMRSSEVCRRRQCQGPPTEADDLGAAWGRTSQTPLAVETGGSPRRRVS